MTALLVVYVVCTNLETHTTYKIWIIVFVNQCIQTINKDLMVNMQIIYPYTFDIAMCNLLFAPRVTSRNQHENHNCFIYYLKAKKHYHAMNINFLRLCSRKILFLSPFFLKEKNREAKCFFFFRETTQHGKRSWSYFYAIYMYSVFLLTRISISFTELLSWILSL